LFPFRLPDLIIARKARHDGLADRRILKGQSTMAQFVGQPISGPHAEENRTANLLNLLAKVRPAATFGKTHHGIQ